MPTFTWRSFLQHLGTAVVTALLTYFGAKGI